MARLYEEFVALRNLARNEIYTLVKSLGGYVSFYDKNGESVFDYELVVGNRVRGYLSSVSINKKNGLIEVKTTDGTPDITSTDIFIIHDALIDYREKWLGEMRDKENDKPWDYEN